MKLQAVGMALVLALGLGGCSSLSSTVDGKNHIFTGKQSCPALLEMDRGQTLEVILDENPTTGYVWRLTKSPKLFKAEELYKSDQPKQSDPPIVGVGGQKTYRFTAQQAGEEVLHIQHARPWEKTSIDEWQCRVRIS